MRGGVEQTTMPDGREVPTADLVAIMRQHRGRATRRELCIAIGLDPNIPAQAVMSNRIVQKFNLTVSDPPRHATPAANRPGEMRLAREALAREIALAHLESATAPPYRDGRLEW
jgi:hypothetical protein